MEKVVRSASLTLLLLLFSASITFSVTPEIIVLPEEAVAKKTLDNGLTILAKYSLPQGLAAIDVKVETGSSLEGEYLGSGISHLVEHMIFKGTAQRPVGAIEKEVKSYGGIINGSASHDMTDFYIILPSKYLPQGLAILKDMLLNARMDAAELVKEKEVVLKEIRMNKDEPLGRLMRLLNEKAYLTHPYRYPTIGYEDNLKALTSGDLIKYYTTRYVPNRMIVTVVGGVDTSEAISAAEKEFKDFRRSDYGREPGIRVEPVQIQHRREDERMETSLAYLAMGFHSTSLLSEDLFAMDVLSTILGRGDNSRLNTVLHKDKGLVHTISSWNYTPRDPGLFVITAVLDENKVGQSESSITDQLALVRTELVRDDEIEAARRVLLADLIRTLETVEGQADDISTSYALTGSEKFSARYIEGIHSVTKEDIKAVANRYLRADNLTIVTLLPRHQAEEEAVVNIPVPQESAVEKLVLPNGLKIFVRKDDKVPTVAITAAVLGGYTAETEAYGGISRLTADMLLRGTRTRPDSGKIKGRIEELGGEISAFGGANTCGVNISVLKPDADLAIEMVKDMMTNAIFPQREFEKSKESAIASIRSEDDDIFEVGMNALKRELFTGSAYSRRNNGTIESVSSFKREDASAFYNRHFIPNNMVISVSGDVDTKTVLDKLKELFSAVKDRDPVVSDVDAKSDDKAKLVSMVMDKEQSLIMLGFKTVPRKDPDRYSLEILGAVMSGSSGRLFDEVRNVRSLAYTLGCWQDFWTDEGILAFYVATTKDKLPEAKTVLIGEFRKLKRSGITDDELAQAKRELTSRHRMAMQSNAFFTLNFAVEELRGLGYDNIYKYEDEIDRVTKEDVKRVADRYINFARCTEVKVSPK